MADREIGNLRTRLSWEDQGATQSVEGFRRDLRGLRSEMNLAKSGGKEYTQSLKGLREQSDILTRRFKTQKQEATEIKRRYDELAAAGKENTVQAKNLQSQYNNTTAQMNRTEQQLKRVNAAIEEQTNPWKVLGRNMEQAGEKMQNIGRNMSGVGRILTTRVTLPLVGLAGAALKTGMDFEEGMSNVQAVSGATGSEMDLLREQAREMGATTRFSATEASEGMSYLAQAGFDVNQIMETMPGLLDLAAASGMDLGRAADLASNVLSGFNLDASEAGRVSDVFAKGASTANTNVEQLGSAMETVAPIAEMVGLEVEELTAGVGRMSDAGIQGQKAGRMLRQGILRLSDPTGKAADLIDELGINVFDSEGNMKSLDKVVGELNKGLQGMDADAKAAALSTIFGSESTAGWSALLKVGEKDLKNYTKELKDSDGAAEEMAKTMEDNAKGAWREFKSAAEEAGIALSEHMLPAVTDGIDYAKELVKQFGELDESTQKNILKFGGLAAAMGPALLVTGNLTTGLGGVLRVSGKLSRAIGKSSKTGLLGSMSGLTKAGVAGLAIAGIGALSYGIYKLVDANVESKKVNLDTAQSLSDQATELDENARLFDKLSEKAKISNEELAEMNDLNERIKESSNPGEIKELQEQYDRLAKKSGLSKDEIEKLFQANETIIEQSKDVEKSVSNQGNAFAKNTDAIHEQIQALRDLSESELNREKAKLIEQEAEAREKIAEATKEQVKVEERMDFLAENQNLSKEELNKKIAETEELLKGVNRDSEEGYKLDQEHTDLINIKKDRISETIEDLQGQNKELDKTIDKEQAKLDKLDAIEEQSLNIKLANAGINEEGEEGLKNLDKSIRKNEKELEGLESKLNKTGELSEEERERYTELAKSTKEQREARDVIFDQYGIYNDLNTLVDSHIDNLSTKNRKELESLSTKSDIKLEDGKIIEQVKTQNKEYDKQIKKLIEEKHQNGDINGEIRDQINKLKDKKGKNIEVAKEILKELGLWEDVKETIQGGSDGINDQRVETIRLKSQSELVWEQFLENNKLTEKGIKLEEDRTKEAGTDVEKKVDVLPSYDPFDLSKDLSETDDKTVNLKMNPLKQKWTIPLLKGYAHGTGKKGHSGGLAQVNDGIGSNAGQELIRTPDGKMGMFKGKNVVANLPKGTHVFSAKDTRKLIPRYAHGTNWKEEVGFKGVKTGLEKFLSGSIDGTFTKFGAGAFDFITSNLTNKINSIFEGISDTGKSISKSAGKWAGEIRRAAAQMGQSVSDSEVQGIISQINRESNGNAGIIQSSAVWDINMAQGNPARGLLQYIPQTFNAYKVPGYNNIMNGYHQLLAFFNNKNWRRDLPYGRRGWGPTGGRRYAMGTNNHPGGMFEAGEKGWELGRLGDHWEILNHGVYDRPRGYEVFTHQESKKIMNAMNNIPKYANGTRGRNSINNNNRQSDSSDQVISLLKDISKGIKEGKVIQIGDKEITQVVNEKNAIESMGRIFD